MSDKKKKMHFKSGFTLIELIVTLGIMGIVLAMAYSMGDFGNKSFKIGAERSDIQSNTRLAAKYITKELRYSSNAKILTDLPSTHDMIENYKYIYVDVDGILKQYDNVNGVNKGKITNIVGDALNNITNTLEFEIQNSETVDFSIQETLRNQNFRLKSTVLLLNIGNNILTNNNGPVISYINKPIITNNTMPYTDLVNFEKNMIAIVDPDANISFNNIAFNLHGGSVLMQAKSVQFSNSGNNIQSNIAIKADTLKWSGTSIASGNDAVLDVNNFLDSPGALNSNNYGTKWHTISEYPSNGYWKYIFNTVYDNNVRNMTIRSIDKNIDLSKLLISYSQAFKDKLHYFSGTTNKITDNKLPNYKGDISSVANVKGQSYEYIISRGDLTIDTSFNGQNPTIRNFNFNGIIYCDGVLTVKNLNLDSNFSGIIIAKGLIVTAADKRNWDGSVYSNNTINNGNGLTEINEFIKKITIP